MNAISGIHEARGHKWRQKDFSRRVPHTLRERCWELVDDERVQTGLPV